MIPLQQLQARVIDYVTTFFAGQKRPDLVYHNYFHTTEVVEHTAELAGFYQLNEEDRFIVTTAAWFHDMGYCITGPENHESVSAMKMYDFLSSYECPLSIMRSIAACILATRLPANPVNLREQILCDADTWHLGTPAFFEHDERVRQEFQLRREYPIQQWQHFTLRFLQTHHYFTTYCQEKLEPVKQQNMAALESMSGGHP